MDLKYRLAFPKEIQNPFFFVIISFLSLLFLPYLLVRKLNSREKNDFFFFPNSNSFLSYPSPFCYPKDLLLHSQKFPFFYDFIQFFPLSIFVSTFTQAKNILYKNSDIFLLIKISPHISLPNFYYVNSHPLLPTSRTFLSTTHYLPSVIFRSIVEKKLQKKI